MVECCVLDKRKDTSHDSYVHHLMSFETPNGDVQEIGVKAQFYNSYDVGGYVEMYCYGGVIEYDLTSLTRQSSEELKKLDIAFGVTRLSSIFMLVFLFANRSYFRNKNKEDVDV